MPRGLFYNAPRLFSTTQVIKTTYAKQVADSLKSELEHENANKQDLPEDLGSFSKSSGFKILPTDGQSLGKISKDTPAEVVYVFFDVNQVVNVRPDENEDLGENDIEEAYEDTSYINLNVIIEKKVDKSAVSFDVLVGPEDGSTYIENVTSYANVADALTESAEADQKRETSYMGPPFSNLDESLQVNLENYLTSRGINNDLYQFIVQYGIHKENVEYLRWLEKLNKFFK